MKRLQEIILLKSQQRALWIHGLLAMAVLQTTGCAAMKGSGRGSTLIMISRCMRKVARSGR